MDHANPQVRKACIQLEKESQELNRALQVCAQKFHYIPLIDEPDMRLLFANMSSTPPVMVADAFGRAVQDVVSRNNHNKSRILGKVGEYVSKVFPLASLMLGLASTASSGAAFLPLKGAVNGISALLSIAMEEKKRANDYIKQLERATFQAQRIAEIQKHAKVRIEDVLLVKSIELMAAIISFLRSGLLYFKHDYFFNLGKTLLLGPQIYSDAKDRLCDAIADYDQAILLQIANSVLNSTAIARLAQEKSQRESFMEWLGPSYFKNEAQLVKNRELRTAGTLGWILDLDEFRHWRMGSEDKDSVLWISGLPGTGKSITSAFLVDLLRAQYPDAIVLYFFIRAGELGLSEVCDVIRCYAAQMGIADEQAQKRLLVLKGQKSSLEYSPSALFKDLISEVALGLTQSIYVVLDGLDECETLADAGAESPVLGLLKSLISFNCRLLVASRPSAVFSDTLGQYPKIKAGVEHSSGDISKYIAKRVGSSKRLQNGFQKMDLDAAEYMMVQSAGNFLWVSIVLGLLEKANSLNLFKKTLETVPQGLGNVYKPVLERLEEAGDLEWALAILEWLVFARRQFTLDELEIAVEATMGDELMNFRTFIETECGAFLTIAQNKNGEDLVHIGHETFRSYIIDPSICSHALATPDAQARIATVCLQIVCNEADRSASLRAYCLSHWITHLNASNQAFEPSLPIARILVKFLNSKHLYSWVKHVAETEIPYQEPYMWMTFEQAHDKIVMWTVSNGGLDLSENKEAYSSPWLTATLPGASLGQQLCKTFARVWLDTPWQDLDRAKWVYLCSLKLCRIFKVLDYEYTPPNLHPLLAQFQPTRQDWKHLINAGDYDISAEQLDDFLRLGRYDSSLGPHCFSHAMARLYSDLGKCSDGVSANLLMKAIDDDPGCFIYYESLGHMYCPKKYRWADDEDSEKALEYYRKAVDLDPHEVAGCSSDYWMLLSATRQEKGDFAGAIQAYKDALARPAEQNGQIYWEAMAQLYRDSGDLEGTKGVYRDALQAHPEDGPMYYRKLAGLEWEGGDWRAECEVYHAAIAYDREHARDYRSEICGRAMSFQTYHCWEPCFEILLDAVERDEVGEAMYKDALADAYLQSGRLEDALTVLGDLAALATKADPFEPWMWVKLGDAHLGAGEVEKAIAAYKEAQETHPNSLGRAYLHCGQLELAVQYLKAGARKLEASGPGVTRFLFQDAMVLLHLAAAYEQKGRHVEAEGQWRRIKDIFDTAIAVATTDGHGDCVWRSAARQHAVLGYVSEKLGEPAEARSLYTKAVELFAYTTFVEDDEIQRAEHDEAVASLARLAADPPEPIPKPNEAERRKKLRWQLVLERRSDWAVKPNAKMPLQRPRG